MDSGVDSFKFESEGEVEGVESEIEDRTSRHTCESAQEHITLHSPSCFLLVCFACLPVSLDMACQGRGGDGPASDGSDRGEEGSGRHPGDCTHTQHTALKRGGVRSGIGVRKLKEVEDKCVFAFNLSLERFESSDTPQLKGVEEASVR